MCGTLSVAVAASCSIAAAARGSWLTLYVLLAGKNSTSSPKMASRLALSSACSSASSAKLAAMSLITVHIPDLLLLLTRLTRGCTAMSAVAVPCGEFATERHVGPEPALLEVTVEE